MNQRQLKYSLEYKQKVRGYAKNLAKRYRPDIAAIFIRDVGLTQKSLLDNNEAGTRVPYVLLDQKVILRELYFNSGPIKY